MLNSKLTRRVAMGRTVATLATLATAFAFAGPASAADYTLSVNTALAANDPLYKGLEALQANVAEASGGRL